MSGEINKSKRIKENHQGIATILAFACLPLSGFATDIYLPSLPAMAADMHVTSIQIQCTIPLFIFSYGISQLFTGSLLDSYGRYRVGLAALLVFGLASGTIAVWRNLYLIYGMRVVQGIAVGAIVSAKRAYFVDMFKGEQLKNYLSWFSIIWSTGPIVAPFVGGYLQTAFGWEANFYALVILSILLLIGELIFSGETLKQPMPFQLRKVIGIYGTMLKTGPFILGVVLMGLAYSMVMIFNMTGPFIIEHHLQLSAVTAGYSSLILGAAWMVGGFVSKAVINRPFVRKLMMNNGLQLVVIFAMLGSIGLIDNLYSLIFFAFVIHATAGFTFNNYMTFSMTRFPNNAGIASGLIGGVAFVVVSSSGYVLANLLPAKDSHNLGYSYLILILISTLIMFFVFRGHTARNKAGEVAPA